MECDKCKNIFSNKYTLVTHQKNSKTCGDGNKFKCEFCNKLLSSKTRLLTHTALCKLNTNKKELISTKLLEYEVKIESLERRLKEKTEQLDLIIKNQTIHKPLILTPDIIREKISSKLDIKDIQGGQKGIARFIIKNILKDESGDLLYRCVDISRNKFVYYDVNGNRCVDYRAQVLINCMILSKFFDDMLDISKKFYNIDDTDQFIQWYNLLNAVSDIRKFERNKEFRRYISMLTI